MGDLEVKQLVVFSILMESEDGIMGKSPKYILEKFKEVKKLGGEYPQIALNQSNQAKYERWLSLWEEIEQ